MIQDQGWNSRILHVHSHATTHLDAPRHFIDQGETADQLNLQKCIGPARVIDVGQVAANSLIHPIDLGDYVDQIQPGDRVILKTGWSQRAGQPECRN
mgnify:CR=1 FL=1